LQGDESTVRYAELNRFLNRYRMAGWPNVQVGAERDTYKVTINRYMRM
jgi:hypothetical protein